MEDSLLSLLFCRGASRFIAAGGFDERWGARPSLSSEVPAPQVRWVSGRLLLARVHLLICSHCRRYLRQIRLLGRAARAWAGGLVAPEALKSFEERLLNRLT